MVPTNQYLQMDVRMRQAKMKSAEKFGGVAMNVCGDFLQLPPVDKDNSRKSLAKPLNDSFARVVEGEDGEVEAETVQEKHKMLEAKQKAVEARQGWEL